MPPPGVTGSGVSVLVTERSAEAGGAVTHAENSDVLFAGSVAVDVITLWPLGTAKLTPKLALPKKSVATMVKPMKVWPSPLPEGSQAALAKNSTRKFVIAVLLSVPEIVAFPATTAADVMTG